MVILHIEKYVLSLVVIFLMTRLSECKLTLVAEDASKSGWTISASWSFTRKFSQMEITWESVTYISEPVQQVAFRMEGRDVANYTTERKFTLKNLKLDQQYRFCVTGSGEDCHIEEKICSYIRVPRYNNSQRGPYLYLVFGPVHSTNVTLTWAFVPKELGESRTFRRPDSGYRLEWRRVDGRVGGHPGHSSNVVSSTHIIKGLHPAMRYELCVGEPLAGKGNQTCDLITTEEDLPGPPMAEESSCFNQARGTHWRCDITWKAPKKPNGKIRGYIVAWKDQEGYTLMESIPRGVLCDPYCVDSQVLTFHPQEVCIRARTALGRGWESCVLVTDISTRILALFDTQLLLIVTITLFVFKFGARILKAILRCCVRGLYRQLEPEKEHPV